MSERDLMGSILRICDDNEEEFDFAREIICLRDCLSGMR